MSRSSFPRSSDRPGFADDRNDRANCAQCGAKAEGRAPCASAALASGRWSNHELSPPFSRSSWCGLARTQASPLSNVARKGSIWVMHQVGSPALTMLSVDTEPQGTVARCMQDIQDRRDPYAAGRYRWALSFIENGQRGWGLCTS
jgi:hypothetical protein